MCDVDGVGSLRGVPDGGAEVEVIVGVWCTASSMEKSCRRCLSLGNGELNSAGLLLADI